LQVSWGSIYNFAITAMNMMSKIIEVKEFVLEEGIEN